MPSNFLPLANTLIPLEFRHNRAYMEEAQVGMKVNVDGSGVNSVAFSFDKNLNPAQYPKGLFPFFNQISGAHSVCDYMFFVAKNNKLYVLLVELKLGEEQGGPQLRAGECLAKYLVDTVNRINGRRYSPIYRKITVRGTRLIKKGSTKMQDVVYRNGFAVFNGRIFCLDALAK